MSEQAAYDQYNKAIEELHDATPEGYTSTRDGQAKASAAFRKLEKAEQNWRSARRSK